MKDIEKRLLTETLRAKEQQLAKAQAHYEKLRHECNTLRVCCGHFGGFGGIWQERA